MKNLIKQILKESSQEKFINLILDKIRSGQIKAPYFVNLKENYGLSNEEIKTVLSIFFSGKVNLKRKYIYNKSDELLYVEDSDGYWQKNVYDERDNEVYTENSNGWWRKSEYDDKDNLIYYENSNGHWVKQEHNEKGDVIYYEDSNGLLVDKR